MNYGVDPNTAVLIVSIFLPAMFITFLLVGTIVYLRRRAAYARSAKARRAADAESGTSDKQAWDYEKWLETVMGADELARPEPLRMPTGNATRGQGEDKQKNKKDGVKVAQRPLPSQNASVVPSPLGRTDTIGALARSKEVRKERAGRGIKGLGVRSGLSGFRKGIRVLSGQGKEKRGKPILPTVEEKSVVGVGRR